MLNSFIAAGKPFAIIFGHEMDGVQQSVIDMCDGCIEIPQSGTKHSINISVCAGVVCWEIYRQLK
jgi:tRNA G18 (ribose-2'-O)-methylase SpoU